MSGLVRHFGVGAAAPQLGDWSGIVPLGSGPGGDAPMTLDRGNETFSNPAGRVPVSVGSAVSGRTAVVVVAGQSYAANMPASDPYAGASVYAPTGAVFQLDVFDGKLYRAIDPLLGTSGVGGSMWGRMADGLISSGKYDSVVLVPLAVGGTSVDDWVSSGPLFRKLTLGFRELQDLGITPTQFIWEQGVADSLTDPGAYQQKLLSIFGVLRAHGMTAPIYMAINSLIGGTLLTDPALRAAQAAFGAMQRGIATGLSGSGIFQGVDFDHIPVGDYSSDGHFTTAGLDDAGSEWAALIDGVPTITPWGSGGGFVARNDASGQTAVAVLANGLLVPVGTPTSLSRGWTMLAVGDTNGDGTDDLVLRQDSDHSVQLQMLSGSGTAGGGSIDNSPFDPSWQIVGLDKFNHDSSADLVWQQAGSGIVEVQFLAGAHGVGGGLLSYTPFDATWKVIGIGHANSAGESDLLYRQDGSQIMEVQYLDGTRSIGGGLVTNNPFDGSWSPVGFGDFRHLGHASDLVMEQPSSGIVEIMLLNGTQNIGGGQITGNTFTTDWRVSGIEADAGALIWQRKSDGLLERQQINGATQVGGGVIQVGPASFGLESMFGSHAFSPAVT